MTKRSRRCPAAWLAACAWVALAACKGTPPPDPSPSALEITTSALQDAVAGREYEAAITVANASPPLAFALRDVAAALSWLTIDASGALHGTPAGAATAVPFTVSVTDGTSRTAERQLTLTVRNCDPANAAERTLDCYHAAGATCAKGVQFCDAGVYTACTGGGSSQDVAHCGASCGACDPGQADRCRDGACACGTGAACTGGSLCCGGQCVDARTDVAHCGACGVSCARDHAAVTCAAGACGITGCDPGHADCDGAPANGCETSLASDASCGACGRACSPAQGTGHCAQTSAAGAPFQATCRIDGCAAGWADCDGDGFDGCERQLGTTSACASCTDVCPVPSGGQAVCAGSPGSAACTQGSCTGTQSTCSGACVEKATDVDHCGACGNVCRARPNAQPACTGGGCGFRCNPGYADCDGLEGNGCETQLGTTSNCAACGDACQAPVGGVAVCGGTVGSYACTPGACSIGGHTVCSGTCVDTTTDTDNCGRCGRTCLPPMNARATCASGQCGARCNTDFGDCDASLANGCETPLGTTSHCQRCGDACTAPIGGCTASGCVNSATCQGSPGFHSCRGACGQFGFASYEVCTANRCIDLNTDETNCGRCGNVCPRGTICGGGSCCDTAVCDAECVAKGLVSGRCTDYGCYCHDPGA